MVKSCKKINSFKQAFLFIRKLCIPNEKHTTYKLWQHKNVSKCMSKST